MIFDKYDRCYKEGVEIGFCRKGLPCPGEETHPGKIKADCLKCNHLEGNRAREELFKKGKERTIK